MNEFSENSEETGDEEVHLRSRSEEKDHAISKKHDSQYSSYPDIIPLQRHPTLNIHQRMRKSHFRPVNDAIARTFQQRQEGREIRVENEGVQAGL